MGTSTAPDIRSTRSDTRIFLRAARFRELANRRNAHTITEQAELCDMLRSHLADIVAQRKAVSLFIALKIAKGTGGTVEDLFGPET